MVVLERCCIGRRGMKILEDYSISMRRGILDTLNIHLSDDFITFGLLLAHHFALFLVLFPTQIRKGPSSLSRVLELTIEHLADL
jgi:hypothetical protein